MKNGSSSDAPKPGDKIIKISIGFTQADFDLVEQAIKICYPPDCELGRTFSNYGRAWELRRHIDVVCRAILRQGGMPAPIAADMRHETKQELAERYPDSCLAIRLRKEKGL